MAKKPSHKEGSTRDLPADVAAWVRCAFPGTETHAALTLLGTAVDHMGAPVGPRLLRCAAVASRGRLTALRGLVEQLAIDWHDVIIAGEYGREKGRLVRVRDLTAPIPADFRNDH